MHHTYITGIWKKHNIEDNISLIKTFSTVHNSVINHISFWIDMEMEIWHEDIYITHTPIPVHRLLLRVILALSHVFLCITEVIVMTQYSTERYCFSKLICFDIYNFSPECTFVYIKPVLTGSTSCLYCRNLNLRGQVPFTPVRGNYPLITNLFNGRERFNSSWCH